MKPESMDDIFHALASQVRRSVLDIVRNDSGCNVKKVCEHFDVSRIAIMKHLTVLEKAGLIVSEKEGRTRKLYFNAVPIQMIYDRWSDEFSALWTEEMTSLKYRLEEAS